MTTTYTLQDGGKITATCAADFVTKLRESSRFDSQCTDQEYMYHLPTASMTKRGTWSAPIPLNTFWRICLLMVT